VFGAVTYPNDNIGIHQLRHLGLPGAIILLGIVWVIAFGVSALHSRIPWTPPRSIRSPWAMALALVVACAFGWMFLSLSNHFINRDGLALFDKIVNDVAAHGAHVTHDEMLELYVHSRLYDYANHSWGWSVGRTYQVASALSGAAFVLVLLFLAPSMAPRSRIAFVGLVLSCGFIQLFFGDVENYTMVTVMILLFIAMAHLFLEGRIPLWTPAGALSLALGFHLLCGWLLPALAYLFVFSWRHGRRRDTAIGLAALVLPISALFVFFHFHGLPIERLWESSHVGGLGGNYARELAPMNVAYHLGMLNVLLLLWPSIVMLPALIYFNRLGADPMSRFLELAALSMVVFTFTWKAQLGIFEDWNLYAPGMVPGAILVARSLSGLPRAPVKSAIITALILTASLHTFAWVVSNHLGRP